MTKPSEGQIGKENVELLMQEDATTVEIPGKDKYHASIHPHHVAVEGKLVEHTQSLYCRGKTEVLPPKALTMSPYTSLKGWL